MHTAVSVYDTMFFGHLLSGDPQRCAPLAAEMIELTERSSSAWNGYFRATSLLARINVQGDHRAVLEEARVLSGRRLTVKSNEARRTAQGLALIDSGQDLDAVEFAEESLARASDASARSTASWVLAEALWLAGEAERAIEVTDASLDLGVDGFPGAVNAALFGLWARHDLGRPLDDRTDRGHAVGVSRTSRPGASRRRRWRPRPPGAGGGCVRARGRRLVAGQ